MSAEAVLWLMEHVENISTERKAISIMEQMLARNLIRHCSGDTSRQSFMYGFHLYYVLEKDHSSPYQGDRFAFKCDWIEVLFFTFLFIPSLSPHLQVGLELFRPERDDLDPSYCLDEGFGPDFLQETVRRFSGNIGDFNKPDTYKDYEFRSFTLDIDSNGKSERPEWGEGKYQGRRLRGDALCVSPPSR